MSYTIWKFPLFNSGAISIFMPMDSQIIHVGVDPDSGLIAFWAIVNPAAGTVYRKFEVMPTGGQCPLGAQHLGTVIIQSLVWHLFEFPA